MTHPIVERRRAERAERIAVAERWGRALAARLDVRAVAVFGSVARGDFNKWSDLDVLVIAEQLPASPLERLDLLMTDSPPGLQPVGWTLEEFADRRRRNDPIAREVATEGVVVVGQLPGPGL